MDWYRQILVMDGFYDRSILVYAGIGNQVYWRVLNPFLKSICSWLSADPDMDLDMLEILQHLSNSFQLFQCAAAYLHTQILL